MKVWLTKQTNETPCNHSLKSTSLENQVSECFAKAMIPAFTSWNIRDIYFTKRGRQEKT